MATINPPPGLIQQFIDNLRVHPDFKQEFDKDGSPKTMVFTNIEQRKLLRHAHETMKELGISLIELGNDPNNYTDQQFRLSGQINNEIIKLCKEVMNGKDENCSDFFNQRTVCEEPTNEITIEDAATLPVNQLVPILLSWKQDYPKECTELIESIAADKFLEIFDYMDKEDTKVKTVSHNDGLDSFANDTVINATQQHQNNGSFILLNNTINNNNEVTSDYELDAQFD